jgi:nucleotide-binding universal stress UspA family protein
MKTIVATTDFSPVSINAVHYAADMANMLGLRLDLLYVYAIPVPVSEVPIPFNVEQAEDAANTLLNKLKEDLLKRTSSRLSIRTAIKGGDTVSEIKKYCETVKPHTVVMGSETANVIERFLIGGKTLGAVRRLKWPLLIVPPEASFKNIRKVGMACDFRDVVDTMRVEEIRSLVNEFKAELHVLYVSDETTGSYSPETVEESGLFQEMLGDLKPKYHFLNEPEIDTAIADYAERNKLDVLIIIPKKHSLVSRIFKHSHSKRLVLHAHVPVMSLHE